MLTGILETLWSAGWVLTLSGTNLGTASDPRDTLVFRFRMPRPEKGSWSSIAFSASDELRLIDTPHDIVHKVAEAIADLGLLAEHNRYDSTDGCDQFLLKNKVWARPPFAGEPDFPSQIVARLLDIIEDHGWSVYATINMQRRAPENQALIVGDTWFCFRRDSWWDGHQRTTPSLCEMCGCDKCGKLRESQSNLSQSNLSQSQSQSYN